MSGYDVVVVGELLVELSTDGPWRDGAAARLAFSGDALNAAAACAATGARTALLTRLPDDPLTDAAVDRLHELGVSTGLVRRVPGQHGTYWLEADPAGERSFVYARRGSTGSQLSPEDVVDGVRRAGLGADGWVVTSGITGALSPSARAAVLAAAREGPRFAYDPNLRPALTSVGDASALLHEVAPHADLVVPSWPGEVRQLLGAGSPELAARELLERGTRAVVVTCGAGGALVDDGTGPRHVPAQPAPVVLDATGAGDSLLGTVVGRLALGAPLDAAVADGCTAAAACLAGAGGLGHLTTRRTT